MLTIALASGTGSATGFYSAVTVGGAAFASSAAGSSPWLGNLGRSYSWASQSSWPTSLTAALSIGTGIALLGAN